jgi:hypothetical protein
MNSDVDIKPASTASTRDLALASVKSDVRRLRAELGVAKQVRAARLALSYGLHSQNNSCVPVFCTNCQITQEGVQTNDTALGTLTRTESQVQQSKWAWELIFLSFVIDAHGVDVVDSAEVAEVFQGAGAPAAVVSRIHAAGQASIDGCLDMAVWLVIFERIRSWPLAQALEVMQQVLVIANGDYDVEDEGAAVRNHDFRHTPSPQSTTECCSKCQLPQADGGLERTVKQ